jgi:outer membrane protein TolC
VGPEIKNVISFFDKALRSITLSIPPKGERIMKNRIMGLLTIILMAIGLGGQEKEIPLSLSECLEIAMRNNLNVAVEVLNPALSNITVSQAKEKFLPQFSFGFGNQNTDTPSYSWLEATESVTAKYSDYQAQFQQEIPTGGRFDISLYSYKSDTTAKFQTINPRYGSRLAFSFTQPLLKNFGFKYSRKEIIVAKNNVEISDARFQSVLMDTVYNVEQAYLFLAYSIANLDVMQQSLELAQDLLAKNKREVEVGTLAPIEILTAQAEVATREADILQAEVQVKNYEDQLKTLINLEEEQKDISGKIIPTDRPTYAEYKITVDEALRIGMENRPDLKELRWDLENKNIEVGYAKNQLLPDLSLNASYWSPGISGTQLFYAEDDPLSGNVIDIAPGNASDALRDVFGFKYNNWYVGLTLTVPTNTVFSRAAHAQARVNREKAQLTIKNAEQQVFLEIRNAVRFVETNFKRIAAYRLARELAEKKLEAEDKKLKVGLTTNYIVLQHQRDLATAQSNELRAIAEYVLAQAALEKAMGVSLEQKNIRFRQFTPGDRSLP